MLLLAILNKLLFGPDALAAIGQNLAASALYDWMKGNASVPLPQRWQSGNLPVNHDIERIGGDCLRRTLHFAATSLASELGLSRTFLSRIPLIGHLREMLGTKPEPADRWVDALLNAALDKEKVAALDAVIALPVDDLAGALRPGDSAPRNEARTSFANAVAGWAAQHAGAAAPEIWALNLTRGFLPGRGKPGRVSLFDVWLLFLREALKSDERIFRAFVVQTLSKSPAAPGEAIAGEAAGAVLGSAGRQLDATLEQHRAWFDEQFGLVHKQLDAIITNDAAASDKLDRLLASVTELHGKIGDTRAENKALREEIDRLRNEQSAMGEAARSRVNLQSVALGVIAEKQAIETSAPGPAAARAAAIGNVASRLGVEERTVELALEEFASTARRQDAPATTAARELGRKVEKQFDIRPAVAAPPPAAGSFLRELIQWCLAILALFALRYVIVKYFNPFPASKSTEQTKAALDRAKKTFEENKKNDLIRRWNDTFNKH